MAHTLRRPDGTPVHLTTAEFIVLHRLTEKPGEVLARDDLTQAAFGRAWRPGDRAVDTVIVNLRLKLDQPSGAPETEKTSCILTVRNAGYQFVKWPDVP